MWDLTAREAVAVQLPGAPSGRFTAVAIAPDGAQFATADTENQIRFWDVATGRTTPAGKEPATVAALAYSPDGALLASSTSAWDAKQGTYVGGSVNLRQTATGKHVCRCPGPGKGIRALAFAPDGKQLAGGGTERDVFLWSVPTGEPLAQFRAAVAYIGALGFSSDGGRLAVGSGVWDESRPKPTWTESQVTVWNTKSLQRVAFLRGRGSYVGLLAFTPTGRELVTAAGDGGVRVWDLPARPESISTRAHTGFTAVAPSPDGRRVVSGGWDGIVRVWDAATGEELYAGREHGADVTAVVAGPDGTFVTGARNGTVIIRDADGRETGRLVGLDKTILGLRYSPNGPCWLRAAPTRRSSSGSGPPARPFV